MKERTLDWRNRRSWLSSLRFYAGDLLNEKIRVTIKNKRPSCWSDVMTWIPNHEEMIPEFCDRMSLYYSHVKAFHGCRPESLTSYYTQGLLGQDQKRILDKFRALFSDLPADLLDSAISKMESRGSSEQGKIWLTGDDKGLIEDFGHYVIQGSEYLMSLAARLCRPDNSGEDYRFRLREIGIPTILEVDIPIKYISPAQRLEVARMILSEWGQLVTKKPLGRSSAPCYVIKNDIPPECIKGHYHPRHVEDPHKISGIYINKIRSCDVCIDQKFSIASRDAGTSTKMH